VEPQALDPCKWGGLQSHWGVDNCGVGATGDLYSRGVTIDPPLGSLLAIVLGDANWFEAIWLYNAKLKHCMNAGK
jgi:hypothetical protein